MINCRCSPSYLDLILVQLLLETGKQDLALAWLEAIHDAGDGALQVSAREEDQLLPERKGGERRQQEACAQWKQGAVVKGVKLLKIASR